MAVEKKDLDWGSLGFAYMQTDYSYVCNYRDGAWEEGGLTSEHTVTLSECAGILHYCQEVFEGLKAYTTENGDIVCFRPDLNAERMSNSAKRLEHAAVPRRTSFVEAVKDGRQGQRRLGAAVRLGRHALRAPAHDRPPATSSASSRPRLSTSSASS